MAFICPLCNKEAEIIYDRGRCDWSSEHGGCVNFSVIRSLPRIGEAEHCGPMVFINLESDYSVKEAVEGLRAVMKEEPEQAKRAKLETGVRRLESKLGTSGNLVERSMSALKSGAFGIKVVSGRGVSALVWKDGERYVGVATGAGKSVAAYLASDSGDEAERFISFWNRYWEQARLP
jgi:hypothetical protein